MKKYSSPVCFLSDCHLPLITLPGQEEWSNNVIRFLREEASRAATICIVGDLFDFWFEWQHSIPSAAFPVLTELNTLVQQGKDIIYLAGNHDGHVGDFLENQVGLVVTRKSMNIEIDGKKFHILHGDGVVPADRGYRILRALVRWKATETIYKLVHPDFGIWFANKVSRLSNLTGGNKEARNIDGYRKYALSKLDEGFNFVVMGHIHLSDFTPHANGAYISIGNWIEEHSYGVFSDGEIKLEFFS